MARSSKSKRANGDGTFYQRKDKVWVHQITVGRKPDGRPERKTFTGATRTICIERRDNYLEQKKVAEIEAQKAVQESLLKEDEEKRRGHSLESEKLFSEAFVEWLSTFKATTKKPTTYSAYLDIFEMHFNEYFGDKQLFEISQDCVQVYYNLKQKKGARRDGKPGGLSPKTIRNQHMLLKDFFKYALKKYKLTDNPAVDTERPEVVIPEMRVLTEDEMTIFISEVMRETQRVAILTDLYTGLRVGELLALEVSDIDEATRSIHVCKNITRVRTDSITTENPNIRILNYNPKKKTHLIVQNTPKTKTSNRVVPLTEELFKFIVRHLFYLQQSEWPNPNNLLFPSTKGTYIDPKSFEKRLAAVSNRCEIRKVNPHALRHTFATRLGEGSVPITIISELMGHSSTSTTERYISTFDEEKRDAVESITSSQSFSEQRQARKLNGAKNRMKANEVRLPSWLQQNPNIASERHADEQTQSQ